MDDTPTLPTPALTTPSPGLTGGLSTIDCRTLLGLLTEDEFGRAVGVVGSTVALWRNKGYGPPFYRFKRNIFYRTADITQWIIENTWDPGSNQPVVPRPAQQPRKPPITLSDFNSGELRGDGTRAPAAATATPYPPTIAELNAKPPKNHVAPTSTRQPAVEDDADEDHAASAG